MIVYVELSFGPADALWIHKVANNCKCGWYMLDWWLCIYYMNNRLLFEYIRRKIYQHWTRLVVTRERERE